MEQLTTYSKQQELKEQAGQRKRGKLVVVVSFDTSHTSVHANSVGWLVACTNNTPGSAANAGIRTSCLVARASMSAPLAKKLSSLPVPRGWMDGWIAGRGGCVDTLQSHITPSGAGGG